MEGDERQPLLADSPASSTPSRNGSSASDELSGERSSPRGAPPTKEHPTSSSSTTPPPAAGTPVPSSSTTPPPAAGTPVPSSSPTAAGVPKGRPAFSSTKRSAPTVATSPSAGVFWDSSGRMRRAPSHPPVPAPPSLRETLRRQGARLDSVGVEKLIGLFGFSLFGSISLLPFTAGRVKDNSNITQTDRIILVLSFGLIWVLASVGILCGLEGKSNFEQAVCRLTARLGILGLTLQVILHLVWMLPSGTFATVCFYIFMIAAVILHLVSWAKSGEETVEEITAPAPEQE